MSDGRHIQIVSKGSGGLIHGFPGIPPNADSPRGAKIKGVRVILHYAALRLISADRQQEVQVSLPLLGVAASKVEIKFEKHEYFKIGGQRPITNTDTIASTTLFESASYRPETSDIYAGRYPFSFDIPLDLPPTIALESEGKRSRTQCSSAAKRQPGLEIQYSLKAVVYRDNEIKFWKDKPFTCTRALKIKKYEHHPAWPIYHHPEPQHLDMASMRLSIAPTQSCYCRGEMIILTAELSCGSYSVIPRSVRFEVKLLQELTTVSKPSPSSTRQRFRQSDKTPNSNILSTSAVDSARVDHDSSFTAELTCNIPECGVFPTVSYRSSVQVAYLLVISTIVHSQHLHIDFPITISPFPSNTSEEEIRQIGSSPSLGGMPQLERPSSSMSYVQTLTDRYTLAPGAATPVLQAIMEDDDDYGVSPMPGRLSRSVTERSSTTLGGDTLIDSHDNHNVQIRLADLGRQNSLSSIVPLQRSGSISTVDTNFLYPGSPTGMLVDSTYLLQLNEEILASWFTELDEPLSSASSTVSTALTTSSPSVNFLALVGDLTTILQSTEKKRALLALEGDKAQVIVDFLDSVLLAMDPSKIHLRKLILVTLYRLSKAANCYPECYALNNIVVGSQEGGGGFCDIHRGRHRDQVLCLKVVRMFRRSETEGMIKLFAKEAILWSQLNHPNILPFYGIYYLGEENKRMCLVSPWMENGNLVNYLQENPTVARRPFICDVITGLEYLHDRNIIHGDLKGVNVLVTSFGRACITDFGLSSVLIEKSIAQTAITPSVIHGGSYRWIAPELLETDSRPTKASDIWAFGCLCYQILIRRVPFYEATSDPAVIRLILSGETPTQHHPGKHSRGIDTIDEEMGTLLKRCWSPPDTRPTCRQIMESLGIVGLAGRHDTITNSQVAEFRSAMRKRGSTLIDLDKIDSIFREILIPEAQLGGAPRAFN
ncbi:hypothetical protein NP233_g6603 [Leucocoprinus birnbaumii]|uniref:Protein kinase domain-containing protein n=1 Tax=Leucocoprinus birnbaumii TaxID=56174 RepID=A0AAD5YPV3_9AGAR|nr:hypothetical protein NP233_g6603 [Leucocoprinus birnbaumii]